MGIDITALELILLSHQYVKIKNTDNGVNIRQQIHIECKYMLIFFILYNKKWIKY